MKVLSVISIFPDRDKQQQQPLVKRKSVAGFSEVLDAAMAAAEQKDIVALRPIPRRG